MKSLLQKLLLNWFSSTLTLNILGPSSTYYSGITGGLEALTAAYENLLEGRIEAAIVGASASFIDPKVSLNYLLMGILSSDGLSRVFDAQGIVFFFALSNHTICVLPVIPVIFVK